MLNFQQNGEKMKKSYAILKKCPLFNGIEERDLDAVLGCLGAEEKTYKKGDVILAEGDPAKYLGIVLSGKVQIIRIDYYGNRSILTSVEPPQIFGESFACAGLSEMPVNVIAGEDAGVLLIDARKITESFDSACIFHRRVIFNLLNIVAGKNLVFHQKIEITSKRSTREKLMTYLLFEAKKNGSSTFAVPYDRQELADYLEVDRSGLSAEIGKLRRESVLECRKNKFTLLETTEKWT